MRSYLEHFEDCRLLRNQPRAQDSEWICTNWGSHKYDKHSCFLGSIEPLEAFSDLPKRKWNARIGEASLAWNNAY